MTATIGAGAAYAAVTHAELDALWRSSGLVETLPPPPTAPTPIPPSYAAGSEAPAVTAGDPYPLPVDRPQTRPMPGPSTRRRVRSPSWAIMSGTDRRGRWNVRRRTNAVAVMVPLAWFLGVAFGPDREHALAGIDRPLVARPPPAPEPPSSTGQAHQDEQASPGEGRPAPDAPTLLGRP